jgi:deoxyribonuclease V
MDTFMVKRPRPRRAGLLHRWDVDFRGAVEIQEKLRKRLSPKDGFAFREIRWIAGADVAYTTGGDAIFGAVVVLSFPDLVVVEENWVKGRVEFPYIPGLLTFREAPVLLGGSASAPSNYA